MFNAVVDKFGILFWVKDGVEPQRMETPEEGWYPIYIDGWQETDLNYFAGVRTDRAGFCFRVSGFNLAAYDPANPPTYDTVEYIRTGDTFTGRCPNAFELGVDDNV